MHELELKTAWVGGAPGDDAERGTFGALQIVVGPDRISLTEVEDTVAQTVRPHIYVSANIVAEWLVANWWRLRWEARPQMPSVQWRQAHCVAAIGHGYAWPTLEVSSDGQFVQIRAASEPSPDAASIRYLRDGAFEVPAAEFESAIDRFVDTVEGRLTSQAPNARTLAELRAELQEERSSPAVAKRCKWQALAGIDPGAAPEGWLDEVKELADDVGELATEEVLAILPTLKSFAGARELFAALRNSATTVDLRWTADPVLRAAGSGQDVPWRRGARAAQKVRAKQGIVGPMDDAALEELLSARLPLVGERWTGTRVAGGGFRNGVTGGRTAVVVTSRHPNSQRFHLARVMGCALVSPAEEHFLPVTDGQTALQKFDRAFAQELLCPWADLDAFSDEHGMDEEGVAEAAEYFRVSEWLILSTLVNREKLSRERLPNA